MLPILPLAFAPTAAQAHPHVFIDTGLRLTLDDQNRLTGVEVTWVYDEFYSLLVLQDMALDPDADGVLTAAELRALQGWDMQWVEGYAGDLYVADSEGRYLPLSGPDPIETRVEDGRLISVHRRTLAQPMPVMDTVIQAYDPEFYTAYDLTRGVGFATPTTCQVQIRRPDEDKAYRDAQKMMAQFPEDAVDVPLMGHLFAETVTVTCDGTN